MAKRPNPFKRPLAVNETDEVRFTTRVKSVARARKGGCSWQKDDINQLCEHGHTLKLCRYVHK